MTVLYILFVVLLVVFGFMWKNYKKGKFTDRQKRRKKWELIGAGYMLLLFAEHIFLASEYLKMDYAKYMEDDVPPTLFLLLAGAGGLISMAMNTLIHWLPTETVFTTEGINFWKNWGGIDGVYPLDTQMTPLARKLDLTNNIGIGMFAISLPFIVWGL